MDCDERFTKAYQVAILRYEGANDHDPKGVVAYERESNDSLGLLVRIFLQNLFTIFSHPPIKTR